MEFRQVAPETADELVRLLRRLAEAGPVEVTGSWMAHQGMLTCRRVTYGAGEVVEVAMSDLRMPISIQALGSTPIRAGEVVAYYRERERAIEVRYDLPNGGTLWQIFSPVT